MKAGLNGLSRGGVLVGLLGAMAGGMQSIALAGDDDSLTGELSSRSSINFNNGSRYQSFSLKLKEREALSLRQTDAVATVLTLFDGNKRLVAGPSSSALLVAPAKAGSYSLYVSGEDATTYGPFEVAIERLARLDSGALVLDQAVAGRLQMPGNQYFFEVQEPALYSIAMDSTDFDSFLTLQSSSLKLENDDFGDGVNAKIQAYLKPGRYQLVARAVSEQPSGAFKLKMERRELPQGIELRHSGEIKPGEDVAGFASMQPVNFELHLQHAAYIELDMRSAEIDALLEVKGQGITARDDDGGEQNNARLNLVLPAGAYQVSAQSVSGQAGLFELSYRQVPMQAAQSNVLRADTYLTGVYAPGRATAGTLQIDEAGLYQMDLSSGDFDVVLELVGNGLELQDDDSAGGTNARIEQYLEPGQYQLKVGSVNDQGRGRYTLSARKVE